MATGARRGGSRRTGSSADAEPAVVRPAASEAVTAPPAAAALAAESDAELVEIMSTPIGAGHGLRLTRSIAGAAFGTLLIAGLAFGAALGPGGAFGPKDDGAAVAGAAGAETGGGNESNGDAADFGGYHDGDASPDHDYLDNEPDETSKPDEGGDEPAETDKPATEPGDGSGDKPDPTRKPEPKPDPKPEPEDPPADTVSLSVWIKEFHPKLEWGSCDGLDFDYYKVVRSKDSTVTWPAGDNDTLIAVVEPGGYRKAYDSDAPHGKKVWYRVFCVRHTEDGYKVLRASEARGIEVPEEPAPPDPVALDISYSINAEGEVVLEWGTCGVDGFGFYKVLKSTWNENPSYMPWTDGTEIIGVVENKDATEWHDAGGDPGQTIYYRVQCLGWINGSKVLLGETAVIAVTMP